MMARALIFVCPAMLAGAASAQTAHGDFAAQMQMPVASGREAAAPGTLESLPGWNQAAASAGCLAMASSIGPYMAPEPATQLQVRGEGEFWRWQLQAFTPDEAERIAYWESAHEWLVDELRARDSAGAREFLAEYRGKCIVAQAMTNSQTMWATMR